MFPPRGSLQKFGHTVECTIFAGIFGGSLIEVFDCHVVASVGSFLVGAGYMLSAPVANVYPLFITIGVLSGRLTP